RPERHCFFGLHARHSATARAHRVTGEPARAPQAIREAAMLGRMPTFAVRTRSGLIVLHTECLSAQTPAPLLHNPILAARCIPARPCTPGLSLLAPGALGEKPGRGRLGFRHGLPRNASLPRIL